ncbi:hypothetical protein GCM10007977_069010 [Dactylosporangium sucinum]|uniref:Uncharacterized protein n=1 Tax=Dactylosporangium sucinum TaxID=1424081 RepID=A0A917X2Q4_9ACTN|nr:hypothetical protein GCM10007977_069010 [Dactylosporangium sucinum]
MRPRRPPRSARACTASPPTPARTNGPRWCWDPTNGNASLSFREAGLPYDREACRALL